MSDITCPFDGDFCQKKQDRLNDFHRLFLHNPNLDINFRSTAEMFLDCPVKHPKEREDICERYRRYLFIIKNAKKESEKQYGQQ